jgi:PIN domain nuclease of toxin-antitoxin system
VGVSFLLDTHVLLWLWSSAERVPERVRSDLADRSNTLLVSAASALEISTKVRLGKLDAPGASSLFARRVARIGASALPITIEHAVFAGSLRWSHRDPFDRLLVAQATLEDATLVTVDSALVGLPLLRVLTW